MTTKARVERLLIEKYGRDELSVCRDEYWDEDKGRTVPMYLYYTKQPQNNHGCTHVGTWKSGTRTGVYFNFGDGEIFPEAMVIT